jgi:ribonucleoside-diphosphate reductase alpha chain
MRVNFLTIPEMQGASARSNLNRMYRRAWDKGLKTTHYLRTLQASNIEKSTIDVKKEQRGVMATQTAATAAGAKQFTEAEKAAQNIFCKSGW